MTWPIIIAIAFLLLIAFTARLRRSGQSSAHELPYALKSALFSPAERSFLGLLEQAVGKHYQIFGKVRIADVATTRSGLSPSNRQKALNRINAKHFDFLLCNRDDLRVTCAIELDDKSHQKSSRQQRDGFVNELCSTIGLPLVRVTAKRAYTVQELRTKILDATGKRLEPSLSLNAAH